MEFDSVLYLDKAWRESPRQQLSGPGMISEKLPFNEFDHLSCYFLNLMESKPRGTNIKLWEQTNDLFIFFCPAGAFVLVDEINRAERWDL